MLLVRDDGILLRTPVDQISIIGRNTQGVRLMQVGDENSIACVALLPHQEPDPEEAVPTETEAAPTEE